MMELRCGCRLLNNACVISPTCTAGHSEQNRPGGPAVPTPKQAQKAQEARESGRRLKPGRHILDTETGQVREVSQNARSANSDASTPASEDLPTAGGKVRKIASTRVEEQP
jgi:hypothetical protein